MSHIPNETYYQTTSEVLGKLYSNTMMVNLVNSRIGYSFTNDTVMTELSTDHQRVLSTLHVGISVTREEWTDGESPSHGQGAKELMFAGRHPLDIETTA